MLNVLKACLGLALLAATFLPGNVRGEENPFKKAAIGDWVSYKTVTKMQGADGMTMETKQTVTAKTEKTVTLKIDSIMNEKVINSAESVIDLEKAYDPTATSGVDAKVEKLGEGDETISVGGKSYACKWVKMKMHIETNGVKMDTESKYWTSPEVPLGGLVKNETTTSMGIAMTMEMTGTGKK